jgi:hypothetical protein
MCRFRFGISDIAECYYNYAFHYRRPAPARRKPDGVTLDLYFAAFANESRPFLFEQLRARGIEVRQQRLSSVSEFYAYAAEALQADRPFMVEYDFYYLPGRREYRSSYVPHGVCVVGLEPDGRVHVVDQVLGATLVPERDFCEWVEATGPQGRFSSLECHGIEARDRSESEPVARLKLEIEGFVRTLSSPDERVGLAGFQAFRKELAELMTRESDEPRVFYVPGLWSFGLNRRHFKEAITKILNTSGIDLREHERLVSALDRLHELWFTVDHRAEAALVMQRPSLLADALRGLDELHAIECEMPARLQSLAVAL